MTVIDWSWHAAQVDYAAAGIFLNITGGKEGGSAPWWEQPGLQMAPGLEAMSQVRQDLFTQALLLHVFQFLWTRYL